MKKSRVFAVCFLLPSFARAEAVAAFGSHSRSGRRIRDDLPSCSCDCCDVSRRRPDEFAFGVTIKCTPSDKHSTDVCDQQCTPYPDDPVLGQVVSEEVLDYQRFCMFECKPAGGVTSRPATQCIALSEDEERRVVQKDGNVKDPAFLYARPAAVPAASLRGGAPAMPSGMQRRASLVSRSASVAVSSLTHSAVESLASSSRSGSEQKLSDVPAPAVVVSPPSTAATPSANSVGDDDAFEKIDRGRWVAEDEEDETIEQTEAALRGDSIMAHTSTHFKGDPYAGTADITAAMLKAGKHAKGAGKAAAEAVAALKDAQSQNWHIALDLAKKDILEVENTVRAEDSLRAQVKAQNMNQTAPEIDWQWQEAIIGVKQVMAEYEERAHELELEAQHATDPEAAAKAKHEVQEMYLSAQKAKRLIPIYEERGRKAAEMKAIAAHQAALTAAATAAAQSVAATGTMPPPMGAPMVGAPMVPMPPR